jgi:hypothetical protein
VEAEDIASIRHQTTTGEDTAGWEYLARDAVNYTEYVLAVPM